MRRAVLARPLVTGMLLLVPATSSAQSKVDLGLKGGINIASVSTGNFDWEGPDTGSISGNFDDSRTGFVFGGFARASWGQQFFMQPELLYSQKGGRGEISSLDSSVELNMDINYLSIPVLIGVKFPPEMTGPKPRVFIGPEVNLELMCTLHFEAEGVREEATCATKNTQTTDIGIVIGAGVDFEFKALSLTAEFRYDHGLTDRDKTDTGQLKNRAWQFMAGVSTP